MIEPDIADLLDGARGRIAAVATDARRTLSESDRLTLLTAFHRAETLAEHALAAAVVQVDARYREELLSQIADEQRHVAVFARWFQGPAPEIVVGDTKSRPDPVWFALLLLNEITGFCQFEMLAALESDPDRQAAIRDIAQDERIHIARLVRWLRPFTGRSVGAQVRGMARHFLNQLEARMLQFLPRAELGFLRATIGSEVDALVRTFIGLGGAVRHD